MRTPDVEIPGERSIPATAGGGTGVSRTARLVVICAIHIYQGMIRPFLIGSCKFHPTCSNYAAQAVQAHGVVRGGWLALRRLLRCHPFGPGGPDPVPDAQDGADRTSRIL